MPPKSRRTASHHQRPVSPPPPPPPPTPSASASKNNPPSSISSAIAISSPHSPATPKSTPSFSSSSNVKVVVRVRPPNELELTKGGTSCVSFPTPESIDVQLDETGHSFTFDGSFDASSTQEAVFEAVARPIISDILKGYNGTIFAYGQTSSGKTYTMEGLSLMDFAFRGIIPRSVAAIFEGVAMADPTIEFTIKVSYVEIYMERIRDLLDTFKTKTNLQVREDPINKGQVYIAGVTEAYVTNEAELLVIMMEGQKNRKVAATGMNEGSSRSHSVFMITITQRDLSTSVSRSSKLVLIDLAGSEMVRKTQASGQQLEEAKTINKSLSALGLVINALTDEKSSHVPYRDSKLTRVLQDSLGGNSKTVLIINVSPSNWNANETLSTLRFGSRAKSIQNRAVVNESRSLEEMTALLLKAEKEIDTQQTYIMSLEAQVKQFLSGDIGSKKAIEGEITIEGGGDADDSKEGKQADGAGEKEESDDAMEGEAAGREEKGLPPSSNSSSSRNGALSPLVLLSLLEKKVEELSSELNEEREEGKRREAENKTLAQIARDESGALEQMKSNFKSMEESLEVLLRDESCALEQMQSKVKGMEESLEVLRRERDEASVIANSWKSRAQEMSDRREFERQEAEVHANKLETENARLATEIEELSRRLAATSASSSSNLASSPREATGSGTAASTANTTKGRKGSSGRSCGDKTTLAKIAAAAAAGGVGGGDGEGEVDTELFALAAHHVKVLQEKLEQLVTVHRQLLRRHHGLEGELNEQKKKVEIRDDRITLLEGSFRSLESNLRRQADRHIRELMDLKEQILRFQEFGGNAASSSFLRSTSGVGGGAAGTGGTSISQPRAIRGGTRASIMDVTGGSSTGGGGSSLLLRSGSGAEGELGEGGGGGGGAAGTDGGILNRLKEGLINTLLS